MFLICGIVFSAFVALFYYQSQDSRSKKNIENIRTIYTERTENLVNNMFHKTDVLAAVVKLENGNITEDIFDKTAALVYQENSGIRGIQYMPDAVVTYSYPLEGNEAVMEPPFLPDIRPVWAAAGTEAEAVTDAVAVCPEAQPLSRSRKDKAETAVFCSNFILGISFERLPVYQTECEQAVIPV